MLFRVVAHPLAAASRGWRRVCEVLEQAGGEIDLQVSQHAGHSRELARRLAPAEGETVVAVGGDGTFNEVIDGLMSAGHPVRLGFVSLGTGNDFFRALEIPTDPDSMARRLLEPSPRQLDLGMLEAEGMERPRPFACNVSTGFSAAVTKMVASMPRGLPGTGIYLLSLLLSLASWRSRSGTMRVDGEERPVERLFNLNVANTKYYGGGMYAAPGADPADGLLNVVLMQLTLLGVVKSMPENYRGRFERVPGVWQGSCRTLEIESPVPLVVQADGDVLGTTPARVEVLPGALTLLA